MSIQPVSAQPANGVHASLLKLTPFLETSVREALLGLKNGQVTITVHNGDVVQIDRILKKRQFKSRKNS